MQKKNQFLVKTTKRESLKCRDMYLKPLKSQNYKSFLNLLEVNIEPNTLTRK